MGNLIPNFKEGSDPLELATELVNSLDRVGFIDLVDEIENSIQNALGELFNETLYAELEGNSD